MDHASESCFVRVTGKMRLDSVEDSAGDGPVEHEIRAARCQMWTSASYQSVESSGLTG